MDYEPDSSGTDDDLPPSHRGRFQTGLRAATNGRPSVAGSASLPRMHGDMETQIHNIEQEAYCSVLRAFKAQSDAITWEKESLITELRKELRVSDEEHRELLARVNADDIIQRIREWRKAKGLQPGMLSSAQPAHDPVPSPTVSASRKKQKTSQSVASLSMDAPSPALHPSGQPSTSALKQVPPPRIKGSKPKSSGQYPTPGMTGRVQVTNPGSSGGLATNEPAAPGSFDNLIGRKLWMRWPQDNHFYEAVITDHDPVEGTHKVVYDMNKPSEQYEWVNLNEFSPDDIKWEGKDPGLHRKGGKPGPGRANKKTMAHSSGPGRGRGNSKGQPKKGFPMSQNGIEKKTLSDIEILRTDTLIKEVEKVFSTSHPDPVEVEKAKKILKDHEQSLVDAIARLEGASDGESDGGEHPMSRGQSMDRGPRKRPYDETVGQGREVEGSGGNKLA